MESGAVEVRMSQLPEAEAVTMTVAPRPTEKEYIQGLETIVTEEKTQDHRQGYAIYTKVCTNCGTVADHTFHDLVVANRADCCAACGHNRFIGKDAMTVAETEKVINSKLRYKCAVCARAYDVPTPCCQANAAPITADALTAGWYCTNCAQIYSAAAKPLVCCTAGRLIPGQYYRATRQEYHLKPKFLTPYFS